MQLRLRAWLFAAAGFIAGVAAPANTFGGDTGRVSATFLGLFAAGILPTVTLLLSNMVAGSRSVKTLKELQDELLEAVDILFLVLGFIGIALVALLALTVPTPTILTRFFPADFLLNRVGQGMVVGSLVMVVQASAAIPNSIRRSLKLKADLAIEEALRTTRENAPKAGDAARTFSNPEGFGRVVSLGELPDRGK